MAVLKLLNDIVEIGFGLLLGLQVVLLVLHLSFESERICFRFGAGVVLNEGIGLIVNVLVLGVKNSRVASVLNLKVRVAMAPNLFFVNFAVVVTLRSNRWMEVTRVKDGVFSFEHYLHNGVFLFADFLLQRRQVYALH